MQVVCKKTLGCILLLVSICGGDAPPIPKYATRCTEQDECTRCANTLLRYHGRHIVCEYRAMAWAAAQTASYPTNGAQRAATCIFVVKQRHQPLPTKIRYHCQIRGKLNWAGTTKYGGIWNLAGSATSGRPAIVAEPPQFY